MTTETELAIESDTPIVPPGKYFVFATNLRREMAIKGVRPIHLMRHFGVSHEAIRKWLSGTSLPGPDRLIGLANFLSVPVSTLAEGTDALRRSRAAPFEARVPTRLVMAADPGPVVKDPNFRRDIRPGESLAEMLVDWAIPGVPEINRECEAAEFSRVRGPFFNYRPDLIVLDGGGPALAVEIRETTGMHPQTVRELLGIAVNWREATGGKPLILALVIPRSSLRSADEELREVYQPLVKSGLIVWPVVCRTTNLESALDEIKTIIKDILTR